MLALRKKQKKGSKERAARKIKTNPQEKLTGNDSAFGNAGQPPWNTAIMSQ
jgi:hypothetical protein